MGDVIVPQGGREYTQLLPGSQASAGRALNYSFLIDDPHMDAKGEL